MIIKEKSKISGDLIEDIILRGGADVDFHMSPTNKYSLDISFLNSIPLFEKAVKLLDKHISKEWFKIGLVMDNDLDGIMSASLFAKAMQEINVYVEILIDEGKTHGLTENLMKKIVEEDFTLVVVPDAGSNDTLQHKKLEENNIDFLIIDHHEVEHKTETFINNSHNVVLNNQLLDINKEYTGVGMVFIFIKYFMFYKNIDANVDKYLDLVALGAIGDVSNVADKEIRYYVTKGLNNINNLFIKSVMERKGLQEMTGRDASFSIISMINAVTRIGTVEEKRELFNALVSESLETTTVEVRKKNKSTGKFDKIPTELTIHDITVKACESIKTKQDKIVKEFLDKVEVLYDENVLIGLLEEEAPSSITGLVAMKLADKKQKPVMIGKEYNDGLAGSLRAPDRLDFKGLLTESGLFDFVSGHASAAGWKIDREKLDDLYQYLDKFLFKIKNPFYYVDKLYNKPDSSDIYTIEMHKHVFGGAVQFPTMGYENIKFNKKCINIRGSVTTFFDNGVSFVLFNSPDDIKDVIDSHVENNSITMDIVGSPRINKFGNKEIPQIIIKDYEFLENYDIVDEETNKFGIDF